MEDPGTKDGDKAKKKDYKNEHSRSLLFQIYAELFTKGTVIVLQETPTSTEVCKKTLNPFRQKDLVPPIIPFIKNGKLGFDDGHSDRGNDPLVLNGAGDNTTKDVVVMAFLKMVDKWLETDTYNQHFGDKSKPGRKKRKSMEIPPGKSKTTKKPPGKSKTTNKPIGRKSVHAHHVISLSEIRVDRIVPETVEKQYQNDLYVEVDHREMFYCPPTIALKEGTKIQTMESPKRLKRSNAIPVKVGHTLIFVEPDGNLKKAQIVDFRRGAILIDKLPFTVTDDMLRNANVSVMPENATWSIRLQSMDDVVVQRNPKKSVELIEKWETLRNKNSEAAKARLRDLTEAMKGDGLTEMIPRFLKAPPVPQYNADDYGQIPLGEDPFSRWITQLPRTDKDWWLTGKGSNSMRVDETVECNVCTRPFKVETPFADLLFTDAYGAFQKENKKLLAKRGDKLYDSIDTHGKTHSGSIPHSYNCKPMIPTKVWPWELTASSVAQQLLWDAYVHCGGISIMLFEDAYSKKDNTQLTAQLSMICGFARAGCSNPDRFLKRLKGCGICIPNESQWEHLQKLKSRRSQAMNDFMNYTEGWFLSEIQSHLVKFDYVAFIETFGTDPKIDDDRVKAGYAWNAVCLYFSHGLDKDVFFPATKSLKIREESFFDTYITRDQREGVKIATEELKANSTT
jgi:hypothetical protein